MKQAVQLLSKRLGRSPEVLRFGLVAVAGLIVDIIVAWGLARLWNVPLVFPATVGFFCGALLNYVLHELWTFQGGARKLSVSRAMAYFLSLWATLGVRLAVVALMGMTLAPGNDLAILIAASVVSFFVNFAVSKLWVFRPKVPQNSDDPTD
jgi:putative flippase GtrA